MFGDHTYHDVCFCALGLEDRGVVERTVDHAHAGIRRCHRCAPVGISNKRGILKLGMCVVESEERISTDVASCSCAVSISNQQTHNLGMRSE